MMKNKKESGLHPNNKHHLGYNFQDLCATLPSLKPFVFTNEFSTTIDFSNPEAVKCLNKALLLKHYNIKHWEFPDENLCPPIPGRVEYIHHLNDLLEQSLIKNEISVLDIGTGATCIYPLLGNSEYNWDFLGTDIDKQSLENSQKIIDTNNLASRITLFHQSDENNIITEEVFNGNKFSASMCNPPFYRSQYEAIEENSRKLKGLGIETTARNFSGLQNELWYKGGEKAFLHNYLYQSSLFKNQCFWYTSLVSKKDNITGMVDSLTKLGATEIKNIPLQFGNKISRIIAWTFLSLEEQDEWGSNNTESK